MTLFKKILLLVPVVIVGALLSIIVARPFAYEFSPLPKAVGTEDLSLIDPARRDPHSEQEINRELSLRLWYQGIDEAEKEPAVWGYKKRSLIVGAIAAEKGLPTRLVDWVYPARVRSKEKLAVVPGKYPVILLLHGLGGETIENSTDLGETLAASGYIVIGVEFSYGSLVSTLTQVSEPTAASPRLVEIMSRYPASKPELTRYRQDEHTLWVKDLLFVLSALPHKDHPVLSHANWQNIAIIGHSHGGMVALDTCLHSKACNASVNLDGWTRGVEFPQDTKNHLILFSPSTVGSDFSFQEFCATRKNCQAREITECDLGHQGFSDLIYLKWPITNFTGNKCGARSVEMAKLLHQLILDFLAKSSSPL